MSSLSAYMSHVHTGSDKHCKSIAYNMHVIPDAYMLTKRCNKHETLLYTLLTNTYACFALYFMNEHACIGNMHACVHITSEICMQALLLNIHWRTTSIWEIATYKYVNGCYRVSYPLHYQFQFNHLLYC